MPYLNNEFDICKLGSFYFKDKTIFRVYALDTKSINLIINNQKYLMHKDGNVFELTLDGDYELNKYCYENSKGIIFKDPFSYYSDEEYSYVLDEDKFIKEKVVPENRNDVVIYETNVRDFSVDGDYFGDKKETFLAMAEEGIKIDDYFMLGLDYINNLGISHLQLMPIFDYDLDHSDYNWGYNPLAYNYLYKGYIYDKNNPYAYVNELRQTINKIHKKGIRVTFDVVFNHVYDVNRFDLAKALNNKCYRYKADGTLANGTYCGSEIKSEDPFVRAYLIEMVNRYIRLFDIDGIRMDIMGILDCDTVNEIYSEAKKIKNDFIVYGEGWNMGDVLEEDRRASILNAGKIPEVAMFNDFFRETIKKYLIGDYVDINDVKRVLSANNSNLNNKQSLNYVECHDNYTFYDFLMKYRGSDSEYININRCKLALSLVLLARGIPFIHMGQEFLRTKKGERNSYNCLDDINKIDWNRRVKYNQICDYVKDLISFRRDNLLNIDKVDFLEYQECLIYYLNDYMIIINPSNHDCIYEDDNLYEILFDIDGKCDKKDKVISIVSYSLIIAKKI